MVHRDIKPENILLQDGAALVADFGIALAVHQAGGSRMTQTGMSLGTPAYMSPEQAMGEREIGARSDVYALGAMTYEMLAGEPPFTGPNSQAIVAKVLTEQPPPLRPKRPTVPPAAEAAIMTALQKLPADRWGSAREFSDALTGAGSRSGSAAYRPDGGRAASRRARRRAPLLWAGWVLAGVAAAVAAWALSRPRPELPPSRLAILVPGLGGSGASSQLRHLVFLPDGQTLVYAVGGAAGALRLVRHALDAEAGTPIENAVGMGSPLVSPDGRWILGTQAVTRQVLRLPLDGGSQELVSSSLSTSDAAFAPDGKLWYSSDADLGTVEGDSLVARLHKGGYHLLQILDNGRSALTVRTRVGNAAGPVVLVDLETGAETQILSTPVIEAKVTQGLLVFVTGAGTMQAVPFDPRRRQLGGSPVTVATNVSVTGNGVAQFAVAENGNVAYIPQEPASLVFVDRNGASRLATPERRNFHHPLFSPDGRRLSLDFNSLEGRNVWILDLGEGTLSRATFDRDGHDATWTPDGRFLTYIVPVNRPGSVLLQLLRKRPGSAEAPDTLLTSPLLAYTGVWLKDGSAMVTTAADLRRDPKLPDSTQGGAGTDAAIIRNAGRGPLEPLVASRFNESFVGVSPDGRWISFVSDQSGREEVYVRDLAGRAGPGAGLGRRRQRAGVESGRARAVLSGDEAGRSLPGRGRHRDDAGARRDQADAAVSDRRHRGDGAARELRRVAGRKDVRDGAEQSGGAGDGDSEPAGAGAAAAGVGRAVAQGARLRRGRSSLRSLQCGRIRGSREGWGTDAPCASPAPACASRSGGAGTAPRGLA